MRPCYRGAEGGGESVKTLGGARRPDERQAERTTADPGQRQRHLRQAREAGDGGQAQHPRAVGDQLLRIALAERRSEEHTSELQSLMRISYAVFCLKKKKIHTTTNRRQ